VAWGDPYIEGSETAKVGTDEQKPDMRPDKKDEIAQHIDVQTQEVEYLTGRSGSD